MSFYYTTVYIVSFLGIFLTVFYALNLMIDKRKEKKLTSEKLSVSIIVPAYNESRSIAKTIKSLLAMDYPKEKLEIIVVDDGSADDTYKIAKHFESDGYPKIRVFTKPNGGKGSAVNFGIRKAHGKIVVTMDADSMVNSDTLGKMVSHFYSKEIMAVTPAMAVYRPRTIWQKIQQIEYGLGVFLRKAFSTINSVHVTPGAFSAYRKEFFEKHGGFDEHTITEDLEIALRIQYNHYIIENCPEAVVYTLSPPGFKELMIQRRRWYSGLVKHLYQYYTMLFNPKYGVLGILVLPLAILTVFSTIFLTSYTLSRSIEALKDDIVSLSAVNFDFRNFFEFSQFTVMHHIYSVLSQPVFVIFLVFCVFLASIILFAKRRTKFTDSFGFALILFIFGFSLLFSFWWLVSFFYVLTGKKIAWRVGNKKYG